MVNPTIKPKPICPNILNLPYEEALKTYFYDAYGWADFSLNHGFHSYRKMERWTVSPLARVEILDRLLEENHHRADAEAQQAPKAKGRRPRRPPDETKAMF